jgi:hypothetical protein
VDQNRPDNQHLAIAEKAAVAGGGLRFGADGRLRAEGHVLASVVPDRRADMLGRLVANDVEATISTPAATAGWRFDLLDDGGLRTGEFRPFRLRRGGRLRAGELTVTLQGDSWSHDRWSFAMRDGDRVEATVERSDERGSIGPEGFEISLESGQPGAAQLRSAHALVFAFGCWLIAQWHALAPGDHMLTSEAPADELASALRPVGSGGIAARKSN